MQNFKAVSFTDTISGKSKVVSLGFNEREDELFFSIAKLSSQEIRRIIAIDSYDALCAEADRDKRPISQFIKIKLHKAIEDGTPFATSDITFKNSKSIPFQRWYPYAEGYSPDFVTSIIRKYINNVGLVYEPFAGTGTTIFASDSMGFPTIYSEVNPVLQFLIDVKLRVLALTREEREKLADQIFSYATNLLQFKAVEDEDLKINYLSAFKKSVYFSAESFSQILSAKTFLRQLEKGLIKDLLTTAALSSLIPSSFLKKQGDLRFKTKKELEKGIPLFSNSFAENIRIIAEDLLNSSDLGISHSHTFVTPNAKNISCVDTPYPISYVITSPPYLNGTNYIRNTKLELWFLEELSSDKDLRRFRDEILTSGINDVKMNTSLDVSIEEYSPILNDTLAELNQSAYDIRIPQMAKAYFEEMYCFFRDLKEKLASNAHIFVDLGDSAFNNVHVKTDLILIELLNSLGYKLVQNEKLRERRSRGGMILSQVLIHMQYERLGWEKNWESFKINLPHQSLPFSKKNWGNVNHSLCSYQGKLKPAIAHHLITTFIPEGGIMFDPFVGVGTIPFEACLNGRKGYGMDISIMAYYISQAKVGRTEMKLAFDCIKRLNDFIHDNRVTEREIELYGVFGLNRSLSEYYHVDTLKEILLARRFFQKFAPANPSEMVVISALMHILHGNRPYALSRKSHPITPYAPTGEFIYKNLTDKLIDKVNKFFNEPIPDSFSEGEIFLQDSTIEWPEIITDLDAVITSPPFFDSTRFYNANWIRLWFSGWEPSDFRTIPNSYVDERQKKSLSVYYPIFQQAKERLKHGGVMVLHLGKSPKCNMGIELKRIARRWFAHAELFDESVEHCNTFGLKDIGTVTDHQYLVLY
ncbi:MAG: hypothetical protein NC187_03410 [Candidatus Amulumruptor caecigallinarius]|nr:hypothetical protein [Candidatus Amulumruptor caecigallinarius]MCM1396518.1 hypothetical protein [Candidatus Amulumruptor caecigallinarius]MCM1453424.1 hypothetical protein [bacterium]